jgi:P-type E1-E2 ATPase
MAKREHLLHKITIIGVVTFINQLKEDAKETISALTAAHINTKIITGDNIFLGIQTALLAGIIKPTSKIIVL